VTHPSTEASVNVKSSTSVASNAVNCRGLRFKRELSRFSTKPSLHRKKSETEGSVYLKLLPKKFKQDISGQRSNQSNPEVERSKDVCHCPKQTSLLSHP
jgi:hypothetical protein